LNKNKEKKNELFDKRIGNIKTKVKNWNIFSNANFTKINLKLN